MTKRQFQQAFKIDELTMNPAYAAVCQMARDQRPAITLPQGAPWRDSATVINDEGRLRGWLECVEFFSTIGDKDAPAEPKKPFVPYSAPAVVPTDTKS